MPKFNEPENSQFKIFMEWGDLFCSYAFKVLKVKEKQDDIDNYRDRKEKLQTKSDLIASIELVYK